MARPTAEEQAAKRQAQRDAMRAAMRKARTSEGQAKVDELLPEEPASTEIVASPPLSPGYARQRADGILAVDHADEAAELAEESERMRRPPNLPLPVPPSPRSSAVPGSPAFPTALFTPPLSPVSEHSRKSSGSSLDLADLLAQPLPKRLSTVLSSPEQIASEEEDSELDLDEDLETSAKRISLHERESSSSPELERPKPSLLSSTASIATFKPGPVSPRLPAGYSSSEEEEFDLSLDNISNSTSDTRAGASATSRLSLASATSSRSSVFSGGSPSLLGPPRRRSEDTTSKYLIPHLPSRSSLPGPSSPAKSPIPRRHSQLPKPRQISPTLSRNSPSTLRSDAKPSLPSPTAKARSDSGSSHGSVTRSPSRRNDSLDLRSTSFPVPPARSNRPFSPTPASRLRRPTEMGAKEPKKVVQRPFGMASPTSATSRGGSRLPMTRTLASRS